MNVCKAGYGSKQRGVSTIQTWKSKMNNIQLSMHVHTAAIFGDLSTLQDAISRGEDVNSVDGVSWFVGM